MAAETHRSSSSPSHNYEVFLSFRGEDTRRHFTDHLHAALVRVGIRTFIDSKKLRYGEEIGPELLKAIKKSRISIPVLSENYAFSKWCLQELSKIIECKETDGQIVLPIFYKIDPSYVRNQTGILEKAFLKHEEEKQPKETVNSWRKALTKAANMKGWHTENPENSYEADLVNLVVQTAWSELNKKTPLEVGKYPVGIDFHVEEGLKLIDDASKAIYNTIFPRFQFAGIHAVAGIGKTTLAKAIYNTIFPRFQGGCFIVDARENASRSENHSQSDQLVRLQNILLFDIMKGIDQGIRTCVGGINLIKQRCSNMKVFIVLDDVDHSKPRISIRVSLG